MAPPAHSDSSHITALHPADLLKACPQLTDARKILVGFSGGLDSTVLLHVLSVLHAQGHIKASVTALHINHGLQTAADDWQQHCAGICQRLGLPMLAKKVMVNFANKESPEEAARSARYEVFASILGKDDILLLAHHEDDQVETVLFRLIRGSGTKGLAGIPAVRTCGSGLILRPMLCLRRFQLLHYALQHQLAWIEDSTNID